jgi:hypothetical protein
MRVYISQNSSICKFNTSESWVILSPIEQRIKEKIEKVGKPLKDWEVNIYRGILTGYNEAFIISGEKRRELIKQDPKSDEIIRPILRGRDIKRYGYEFADLWLINSHNGIKEKGIKPVDINNYLAVKRHLDSYFVALEKRQDKGDTPYNLRNCAYMEDFYRQKIAWASVGETYYSLVDENKFLLDTNYFFATETPEILLAFLNSKLLIYTINGMDTPIGEGGAYRHYKYNLEKLPLVEPNETISSQLNSLVKEIICSKNTLPIQSNIDKIIYKLYGLTDDETKFIESQ